MFQKIEHWLISSSAHSATPSLNPDQVGKLYTLLQSNHEFRSALKSPTSVDQQAEKSSNSMPLSALTQLSDAAFRVSNSTDKIDETAKPNSTNAVDSPPKLSQQIIMNSSNIQKYMVGMQMAKPCDNSVEGWWVVKTSSENGSGQGSGSVLLQSTPPSDVACKAVDAETESEPQAKRHRLDKSFNEVCATPQQA
jgi:hypothetical protein